MSEPTNWTLLAKYLSGECNEKENRQIEKWFNSDPENKKLINLMKTTWNNDQPESDTSNIKKLWDELSLKIQMANQSAIHQENKQLDSISNFKSLPQVPWWRSNQVFRSAAIFIILISLVIFFTKNHSSLLDNYLNSEMETILVANGEKQKISLSDGSVITLDAGSSLSYPELFCKNSRDVILNGEAFFEVTPNQKKPFIIHTGHAAIKVLGTKFNVRSWKPENKVIVAVTEGKVSLAAEADKSGESVIITGGQFSNFIQGSGPVAPMDTDVSKFTGWMNNEINFENAPLAGILSQIERWYDVEFILSDTLIPKEHLNIHLKNQTLTEILDLITVLTETEYEKMGKIITIKLN